MATWDAPYQRTSTFLSTLLLYTLRLRELVYEDDERGGENSRGRGSALCVCFRKDNVLPLLKLLHPTALQCE